MKDTNKKLLRAKEVANRLSIGRSTIYRYLANGEFPKPHAKLSKCCTVWLESDIDAYIEDHKIINKTDETSLDSEVAS